MGNLWEIIDENGCVYSGNETDMRFTFENIVDNKADLEWTGDIKLVEVHGIHR